MNQKRRNEIYRELDNLEGCGDNPVYVQRIKELRAELEAVVTVLAPLEIGKAYRIKSGCDTGFNTLNAGNDVVVISIDLETERALCIPIGEYIEGQTEVKYDSVDNHQMFYFFELEDLEEIPEPISEFATKSLEDCRVVFFLSREISPDEVEKVKAYLYSIGKVIYSSNHHIDGADLRVDYEVTKAHNAVDSMKQVIDSNMYITVLGNEIGIHGFTPTKSAEIYSGLVKLL